MLLSWSCSQELDRPNVDGADVEVNFALELEGALATRAISDGTGADQLSWAIFSETGELIHAKTVKDNVTGLLTSAGHSISMSLAKGKTYKAVFWAQNPGADMYKTDDLRSVTLSKTLVANNAEAAAFAYSYLRGHDVPCLLHQVKYNMMHRIPETEGLVSLADEAGSGLIAFSPLAQGLLTDRYLGGIPSGSRAERNFSLKKDTITPELTDKLVKLNGMAARRGQTLAQMALAWVLKDTRVTSVIVGASSREQLDANLKAIGNTVFCDEELTQINALTI